LAGLAAAVLIVGMSPVHARGARGTRSVDRAETTAPAPAPAAPTVEAVAPGVEAAIVPAGPVHVALNLAVDDVDVDAAARRLVVTALLSNEGGEADLALCPALFFGGTERPIQGYAFVPGSSSADCADAVDHAPTLGMSLDAMPSGAPACPAADPVTPTGDRVLVPAADENGPGLLVLQYAFLLADLADGVELEDPATILDRIRAGEGLALNLLTEIDPALTALVCPAGVDTFLAAAPAPEVAALETQWLHAPAAAAAGDVVADSTLHSPASFGAEEPFQAVVQVEWTDNLDVPLEDVLAHDPAPDAEFELAPGEFALGTLTATFPDGLPEGFRGEAVVKVFAVGDPDDTLLSISRHPFVVDGSGPAILAASTVRGDEDIEIAVQAEDPVSGLAGVRLVESRAGMDAPSRLMDYVGGDFESATDFAASIAGVAATDVIGARVAAEDASGNAASATLPVAAAGPDATLECNTDFGADLVLDGSGSTYPPEDEAATSFSWTSDAFEAPLDGMVVDAFLPLGESDVTLTLTDDRGFTGTDMVTYLVEDTTPPTIESVDVTLACLWPPNHKYVRYDLGEELIVVADDVCDPDPAIRIVDVASNQPDNGRGDGNTIHDTVFADAAFCVRSERAGGIRGDRVYTVTVEVADASGNASTGTVDIRVPHDQSGHDCPAVDPSVFVDENWCDLERIGQTEEAHDLIDRRRGSRESFTPPGQRVDRPGRGRRSAE